MRAAAPQDVALKDVDETLARQRLAPVWDEDAAEPAGVTLRLSNEPALALEVAEARASELGASGEVLGVSGLVLFEV